MNIELEELFCHNKNEIMIDCEVVIPANYLASCDIKQLKQVWFKGHVHENTDTSLNLDGSLTGTMIISDAISLEDIDYQFSCEINENIDEFIENNQNSIDILEVLWQNIVLEIPLKYTLVDDLSKYQGDGWKVISEDELQKENPFTILAENRKEE